MMRLAGRGITYPVSSAVSQRCFHNMLYVVNCTSGLGNSMHGAIIQR